MDSGDATSLLLTKIRSLEPDYAPKIIGYLLLQDFKEKDLMNLALGPESVLHSVVLKVKTHLGLFTNTLSAPSTPPSPYLISPPPINGRGGRGLSHSNGFMGFRRNSPSLSPSFNPNDGVSATDLLDDQKLSDCLSFLDDSGEETEDENRETHLLKRSFSDGNGGVTDSQDKVEDFVREEEMTRLKMAYQRIRLIPQLPYKKRMDFLLHQHAHRDGGVSFGDERYWSSSPGRLERMEIMSMHFNDVSNSVARQIYLTFPAESTFKDEDVATYFSLFGAVQDVRIPHQQKRMFGFVSFAHPETVKVVLARGNPHFICDSRVLVKPYKEKGKALDNDHRKHQHLLHQQIERGNYSPCSSPSGIDPRELSDFQLGSKMFYERQEMMRRKMEQADLQRAEFERRRFINLQLPEFKNNVMPNHHRSFSVGSPGYFSSASYQSPDIQSELTSADEDDTTELHPYPVTDSRSINKNNYSNGAKEGTNESETLEPDTGRTIELVLPSNLFPSATSIDDSAESNAKAGVSVSSTNGNDHVSLATTSNLTQ